MQPYGREFYDLLEGTAAPSARKIVPYLLDLAPVRSVVDVGCGDGSWLATFAAAGIADIAGFDGDWVDEAQLRIPVEFFRRVPLDRAVPRDRRFELAISLEVAEHLPSGRAAGFVDDLCALAPLVAFSAAIPDQGGLNHVNEQWPSYWAALFAARGYHPIDCIRPRFWDDGEIAWWYRQNMMLFAADDALARWPGLAAERPLCAGPPRALVHPELYGQAIRLTRPGLGRWLRMGIRAARQSLGRRKGRVG